MSRGAPDPSDPALNTRLLTNKNHEFINWKDRYSEIFWDTLLDANCVDKQQLITGHQCFGLICMHACASVCLITDLQGIVATMVYNALQGLVSMNIIIHF